MGKYRAKFIIKTRVTTMERKINDKKELIKLVSFLTMCDGGVYQSKNKKGSYSEANFIMNHTSDNYIKYAKSILENITSVSIYNRKDYNTDNCNRLPQQRLETKKHPYFTKIRNNLYFNGYKGINSHYLKLMDAECLAMLYMADGSIGYKGAAINSVTLNTKRLTEGDNKLLSDYIFNIFGIKSTINHQNQYTYVRIKGSSIYRFYEIIKPYILNDFLYKIPNDKLLLKYKQDDEIV